MLRHPTPRNDSVLNDGCARYAAGHQVHWIHAKKCRQEPGRAVEILLTAEDVRDDGWVELRPAFDYAGDLPGVWTHAPAALRTTLAGHRGRVYWLERWHALRLVDGEGRVEGLVNVGFEGGELCEPDRDGAGT
ncbi:hypothetical protein [Streptomyces sp. ITFR-16]|uniref:hypothetical protein n=1 Tax=Streptomyces sp. ITFR-16 TaxID=3075198 RepID=UPI0028894A5C|nr:hypothetical protein [Streptomyces sp. ITFR-16]WNI21229.1 hypothetical protein RLT58_04470 [Streptomyces sp. ITFR-16]